MKLDTYRTLSHGSLEALGAAQQPSDSGRTTEFRSVEGGAETMSGETLLVEAYAALWVILFAFVVASWRRQTRIDARVTELERAVSRGLGK
jgi:CcmD family protein